jgi:DNA transformation protein
VATEADIALIERVSRLLEPFGVTSRPLFGGRGYYLDGAFFGFVSGGYVWLRTNDATRPEFLVRGMPAFQPPNRPRGPKTVDRNFRVPDDVTQDDQLLVEWALRAAEAART